MALDDGTRVRTTEGWARRREEILSIVQHYEYGTLPPPPKQVRGVLLVEHSPRKLVPSLHRQYRIECAVGSGSVAFTVDLLVPKGDGPFPVIVRGDWCWRTVSNEIANEVLGRGYALAEFNRCEVAPDRPGRETGIYLACPDGDYGALAAWAWGFHRVIDFLVTLPCIDRERIAVTGHSRGGKAALLAGATDERVALTAPNNSGCGGAGSFKHQAEQSEDIAAITRNFPFWFTPRFARFAGRQERLPFDQHFLKALVAPRALLTTEALGDLWANPRGTRVTHAAAREVYRLFEAEDRLGIHFRDGGHEHKFEDWCVLLDFADRVLLGKPPRESRDFDPDPFANG